MLQTKLGVEWPRIGDVSAGATPASAFRFFFSSFLAFFSISLRRFSNEKLVLAMPHLYGNRSISNRTGFYIVEATAEKRLNFIHEWASFLVHP